MGRYVDWAFPVSVYLRSSDSQRVVTVIGTTKFFDPSTASAFVPMQLLSVSFSHVTPGCTHITECQLGRSVFARSQLRREGAIPLCHKYTGEPADLLPGDSLTEHVMTASYTVPRRPLRSPRHIGFSP